MKRIIYKTSFCEQYVVFNFFVFFTVFFEKNVSFQTMKSEHKSDFYKIKITFTALKWSVFSKKHVFFRFLNFDFDQEIVLNIILFVVFLSANFKCFWKKKHIVLDHETSTLNCFCIKWKWHLTSEKHQKFKSIQWAKNQVFQPKYDFKVYFR